MCYPEHFVVEWVIYVRALQSLDAEREHRLTTETYHREYSDVIQ